MSTELAMPMAAGAGRPLRPLAVVRRRWPSMVVAVVTVLLAALAISVLWPSTYLSSGTILIEQQELPTDLVRSTISSFADQRIQMISQRVMITENLLRIVQRYDLYPEERASKGRESIVAMMRKNIRFKTISADVIDPRQGRPVQATVAFSIGFQHRSPEVAARVANELASLYLQENLETRRQLAENATSFLTEEGDKLRTHIEELDGQVTAFKGLHVSNLPEQAQFNAQLLSRLEDERRDADSQLRALDQQTVYLDAQLAQMNPASQIYTSTGERVMSPEDRLKTLRSDYARVSALYSPDHPDVVRLKRQIEGFQGTVNDSAANSDLARRLLDARGRLAEARQRYGAQHPDVQTLERLVAGIEAQAGSVSAAATETARAQEQPDNPAYIQLRTQRAALQAQHDALKQRRGSLGARLADLERRLTSAPAVEQEYAALTRELDNTRQKYSEVRQKQMEAQLAQNLETERKGERFTLIEPPLAPEEPTSPNRAMIRVFGAVLALIVALGIAILKDKLDGTVRDRHDLASLLTAAPLAVLPWISTDADRAALRRKQLYALAGTAALVLAAIALTHFMYRPLDLLWAGFMRRLGS